MNNPILTNQFIQMVSILKEKSDLRIWQIIWNALVKMDDLYYMEDQDLLNLMTEVYKDFGSIYMFTWYEWQTTSQRDDEKSQNSQPEVKEIPKTESWGTI